MVAQDYGTTGLRKNSQGQIVQVVNKNVIFALVYITLVLDNILLTVVGEYLSRIEKYLSKSVIKSYIYT